MTRRMFACSIALLAGLSAQGCIYVGADVEQIHKAIHNDDNLKFMGSGPLAGKEIDQMRSFDAKIGSDLVQFISSAHLTNIKFIPTKGIKDFNFVKIAKLDLMNKGDLPDVTLAAFDRDSDQLSDGDGSLSIRINDAFDHTAYLKNDSIPFALTLDLMTPSVDWAMDIDLTFAASASEKFAL